MAEILATRELTKRFGGLIAVNNVTMSINRGEVVGLIGPNGSGKTTLINVVSGLYKPDAGKVYFNGEDITGLGAWDVFKKGLVRNFQVPRLFGGMLVFENVMTAFRGQRGENPILAPFKSMWGEQEISLAREALNILSQLQLAHVRLNWATELSGGQMKLVEMARSLASQPQMLLLDEPAAGVAPKLAHDIFKNIIKLNKELGITFIIIEHRLDILFDYVERVLVMNNGKLIFDGSPEDVYKDKLVIEAYLGEAE